MLVMFIVFSMDNIVEDSCSAFHVFSTNSLYISVSQFLILTQIVAETVIEPQVASHIIKQYNFIFGNKPMQISIEYYSIKHSVDQDN